MFLKLPVFALVAATAQAFHPVMPHVARQTDISDIVEDTTDCVTGFFSLNSDVPLLPDELYRIQDRYIVTVSEMTNLVCGWTTAVPPSLSSQWTSYQSEVTSWFSAHSADISRVVDNCANGMESTYLPCHTGPVPGLAAGGSGGSSDSKGSGDSGASHAMGGSIFAAAAAVAGFVGGIALL
jgi:hypothetical protein